MMVAYTLWIRFYAISFLHVGNLSPNRLCCSDYPNDYGSSRCSKCSTGFFYNSTTQACLSCLPGCVNCIDKNSCSQCDSIFVYNSTKNTCDCPSGFTKAGSICTNINGCVTARIINGTVVCLQCNFI